MGNDSIKKIEKDVLIRLKLGDETAFESIYWVYNPRVFHFISSLLYDKSLAEDLTQNVFLKIWEKHEMIDPEQGLEAYLFTIARNMVYKETENRLHSESVIQVLGGKQIDADSLMEEKIDADSLRKYIDSLIEQLPPSRKKIFQLSRREHLSNKEIAAHLSISEKTVEAQLYRSLRFLKEKLFTDGVMAFIFAVLAKEC